MDAGRTEVVAAQRFHFLRTTSALVSLASILFWVELSAVLWPRFTLLPGSHTRRHLGLKSSVHAESATSLSSFANKQLCSLMLPELLEQIYTDFQCARPPWTSVCGVTSPALVAIHSYNLTVLHTALKVAK